MKNIRISIGFVLLALFVLPNVSFADTVVIDGSNAGDTAHNSAGFTSVGGQYLGSGYDYTVSAVDLITEPLGSAYGLIVTLLEYNGVGTTTVATAYGTSTAKQTVKFTFTSPYTMVSGRYYSIATNWDGVVNHGKIYGVTTNSYAGGDCFATAQCGTVRDLYFKVYAPDSFNATSTRIVQVISPSAGQTTATTNVLFSFSYFFNSVVDTGNYTNVGYDLRDVANGTQFNTATSSIVASGQSTFSDTVTLAPNRFYMWRPFIAGPNGYIYGSWSTFAVVSNPGGQSLIPGYGLGDSTASSTDALLNLSPIIRQYFPFSYIDSAQQLFARFTAPSSTPTSINLPFGGWGTSTAIAVNLSTIAGFTPLALLRDVLGWLVYALFGFYALHKVLKVI